MAVRLAAGRRRGHQRPMTTLTRNTAPPRSSSPKAAAAPDGSVKASGTLIQPASPAMPSHRPARHSAPPSSWKPALVNSDVLARVGELRGLLVLCHETRRRGTGITVRCGLAKRQPAETSIGTIETVVSMPTGKRLALGDDHAFAVALKARHAERHEEIAAEQHLAAGAEDGTAARAEHRLEALGRGERPGAEFAEAAHAHAGAGPRAGRACARASDGAWRAWRRRPARRRAAHV